MVSLALHHGGELELKETCLGLRLAFADDMNLCARTPALVQMIPRVQEILADHGLVGR
jgi:hypothetical protein